MSTLRVDKISPFQSSSVEIDGAITLPTMATTGSNTFVGNQIVTGSIDITGEFLVNGTPITGSGGGSIETGSFATTGSNTFTGNQVINGSSKQTFNAPGTDQQVDIFVVNEANIDGLAYTNVFFNMVDYPSFGPNFKDAWIFDYWTDFTYATGSDFTISPKRIGGTMLAAKSGSASSLGISQLRDNNGRVFLNQYASQIHIGAFAPATTDEIFIGHDALPVLRLSSANTEMTGSVIISGSTQITGSVGISSVLELASLDPLPAGAVGQLAVSASNLYFFSGSAWNEISFV